ncbi:MAG: hypothetical protein LIP16_03295 [Clostridium sp.]|nr:hypothetical protein [Clostridium sp.]
MLLTFFMDSFFVLLDTALDALSGAVTLPVDMINVLASILGYGNWIVGVDLLLVFAACVYFWTMTKLSIGLLLFIWRLLPLT